MKDYRVLLIAMSGVRVKDQELLKLGMTLPGFVERSQVIASLPSLSLLTIAGHCPENWEPTYIEIDEISESIFADIERNNYDLVAISTFTARAYDAYEVADKIRALGTKVIMGGLHVSGLPSEAKEHCDAVIVGQGENVWPKAIKDFEKGELKEIYNQKDYPAFSIKDSVLPRYDLIDISRYNRLTLQTSRGCPHNCSFCAASRTISPYQLKPLELIERELDQIYEIWQRPFIELADDNTFVNKRWSKEVISLFKKYPLKWFTETDISVADDPELLKLLAESNCAQILIGFESAVPESLTGIDAHDWKRRQFDGYLEKIDLIQSYGISVNGCFILGLDSDDETSFDATDQFIKTSGLSEVQVTVLTPFPSTELYMKFKAEGRLIKEKFWDQCTLFDVTYKPAKMSSRTLQDGFHSLMQSVYADDRVAKRKAEFRKIRRARLKGNGEGAAQ